jgi:hypothetical protein
MPRERAPKPDTLANAHAAMRQAMVGYGRAMEALDLLIGSKDHQAALDGYAVAHKAMLASKDALNGLYRHLAELKPAPEPRTRKTLKGLFFCAIHGERATKCCEKAGPPLEADASTGPKGPGPGVKGPTQVEDRRQRTSAKEDDPFDGQGEDVADPPRDNREDDDDRDAP